MAKFWQYPAALGGGTALGAATVIGGKAKIPEPVLDLAAWQSGWADDPIILSAFVVCAVVAGIGAYGTIAGLFKSPATRKEVKALFDSFWEKAAGLFTTKADLAKVEANILAKLAEMQQGAAPGPELRAAQEAAVGRVLTSREKLDEAAKAAMERGDVDGAIAAMEDAAREDKAEAARRYRDVGALLFGRSVAKSIESYEEAERLAPGDFRSRIFLSRLYQEAGKFAMAENWAQAALDATANARERSVALDELGDVLVTRGDLDGALRYFREGLEISRTLAAADPASAQAQRDLSISVNKLGDVLVTRGDLDGALRYFREGLEIRRTLAAADPASAQAQRDVSVSTDRLGDVLVTRGDLDGALRYFREGLEISRTLAAADPANMKAQLDLGISYAKLGQTAEAANDRAQACADFLQAKAQFEAVLAAAPGWAEAKRMAEAAAQDLARLGGA